MEQPTNYIKIYFYFSSDPFYWFIALYKLNLFWVFIFEFTYYILTCVIGRCEITCHLLLIFEYT